MSVGAARNGCKRLLLCGKLTGLAGVTNEDEANFVRSDNAGHVDDERECLTRPEWWTKWRSEQWSRLNGVDGDSRGDADRRGEQLAAEKPAHFCARRAH